MPILPRARQVACSVTRHVSRCCPRRLPAGPTAVVEQLGDRPAALSCSVRHFSAPTIIVAPDKQRITHQPFSCRSDSYSAPISLLTVATRLHNSRVRLVSSRAGLLKATRGWSWSEPENLNRFGWSTSRFISSSSYNEQNKNGSIKNDNNNLQQQQQQQEGEVNGTPSNNSSDPPVWTWVESVLPLSWQPYARLARLDKPIGTMLLVRP